MVAVWLPVALLQQPKKEGLLIIPSEARSKFPDFGRLVRFTHFRTFDIRMGNLGWLFSGILLSRSMIWAKFGTKFTSKAPNYVKNFSRTPVVSGW